MFLKDFNYFYFQFVKHRSEFIAYKYNHYSSYIRNIEPHFMFSLATLI